MVIIGFQLHGASKGWFFATEYLWIIIFLDFVFPKYTKSEIFWILNKIFNSKPNEGTLWPFLAQKAVLVSRFEINHRFKSLVVVLSQNDRSGNLISPKNPHYCDLVYFLWGLVLLFIVGKIFCWKRENNGNMGMYCSWCCMWYLFLIKHMSWNVFFFPHACNI